jgi:hypothetical protein
MEGKNEMKKVMISLLSMTLVILFIGLSWEVEINFDPYNLQNWVKDTFAESQGQKTLDLEYMSCRGPTNNPELVAMLFKVTCTNWGKQRHGIPRDV